MLKIILGLSREEWIAHRNFDPIVALKDSCLTDPLMKS